MVQRSGRKKVGGYHVARDDIVFRKLLGDYHQDEPNASLVPWEDLFSSMTALTNPTALSQVIVQLDHAGGDDNGGGTSANSLLTPSVRQLATTLPFAMRFQVERLIFSNPQSLVPLHGSGGASTTGNDLKVNARKLLLVMRSVLLPVLLEHYHYDVPADCRDCNDDGPNVFAELWADAVWDTFLDLVKAIVKGKVLDFVQPQLSQAMQRAKEKHESIKHTSRTNNNNHGDDIYPDYRVPMLEYHAKICPFTGQLRPTDPELLPLRNRRIYREISQVSDRYMLLSKLDYDPTIVDLLYQQPMLANRSYQYLLDKGAGKPTLWLYSAPPPTAGAAAVWTREHVLLQLGDFSNVAATKLGDRLGLSFTQTVPIERLRRDQIEIIPDIIHNNYVFSDGVGVMGRDIAERIKICMGLTKVPGAVQIRMGGVKGMLSLKTDFPADKVGIRPSMVKFPSNHTVLEIKRVATANQSPENKIFAQCILNLWHMMPEESRNTVFTELQKKACAEMAFEFDPEGQERLLGGDMTDIMRYTARVIHKAKKDNGQKFTAEEYQAMKKNMIAARTKDNLRCSVVLMQGVIDEHNALNPGEVLVGNGLVEGPVWVFRSPVTVPGDIQRAYAVPRKRRDSFTHLDNVLVFSARGNRPLADKLAGGDLDGDEYYVITEPRLIGMLNSAEPKDYGSQKHEFPSIAEVAANLTVGRNPTIPSLAEQLEVFRALLARGNLVGLSGDAWMQVAEVEGPESPNAVKLANLHQQSLDLRKLGADLDEDQLSTMHRVRRTYPKPCWKDGSQPVRGKGSILTTLYLQWHDMIVTMTDTEAREFGRPVSALDESESQYLETCSVSSTIFSTGNECVVCLTVADMKCQECGSWCCSVTCEAYHREQAGHSLNIPSQSGLLGTEIEVSQYRGGDVWRAQTKARNILTDIAFNKWPPHPPSTDICFKSLSDTDLQSLAAMVQLEFYTGLRDAAENVPTERSVPHVDDVFLANGSNERLLCRRWDGELVLVNKSNKAVPIEKAHRIGSISGAARILEHLLRHPVPGSLMDGAMRRDMLVNVIEKELETMHPLVDALNPSQQKVVATVLDESFQKGFLAVHSPPGSGKTKTAVGIVVAVGGDVIVAAPSNAAVANCALRIFETGCFRHDEIIVWGDGCQESVRFLNPRYRYDRFQAWKQRHVDSDDETKSKALQSLALWLHCDKSSTLEQIKTICQFSADPFASARVLLCTLNTAGSPTLRKSVPPDRFELFVLDEAAQCPEAEFYIATTFPGVRRIVLMGDPKQLPATVINRECEKAGFGESFLSRVLEFYPEKVHVFDCQYRSDPKILHLYNTLFYDASIQSDESIRGRRPVLEFPLKFMDTSGMGNEATPGRSWTNEYEVMAIESILQNDEDILKIQKESSVPPRIIVISPYKAQVELLKKQLQEWTAAAYFDIDTVDAFQGQEADIVILSTVRTRAAGFVDDARRMNVGISRARRILRVVADLDFFASIDGEESTLRMLAQYAKSRRNLSERIPVHDGAWRSPDWTTVTKWRPTMTARFHNCLKEMGRMHRNLALNCLLAVVEPRCKDIERLPEENASKKRWHITCLRKGSAVQIVWIAKEFEWNGGPEIHYVGTVEAHFAGSRSECLRFTQVHHQVPSAARPVRGDLSGIVRSNDEATELATQQVVDYSWVLTNPIQRAVMDNAMEELPEGLFALDELQEGVVGTKPPLLLESRSGTGKTNVLFQHAVSHAKRLAAERNPKPICFVTVSTKLRTELERRFIEVQEMHQVNLPEISFFSFRDLLEHLLETNRVNVFEGQSMCKFSHYAEARKSHAKLQVDANLIEAEVGGVILGSLKSALQRKGLDRHQYLEENRSNVSRESVQGRTERHAIFDEYERYQLWKRDGGKYDLPDVVLELCRGGEPLELFQSLYIDEVQDFSFASIYLLCSLAGKTEKHWVAAGDTAQMISPGCSFKFAGMKQVLRAIDEATELRKVVKLRRNYRMTKGVLDVGNAILKLIRQYFPDAIESVQPELPMKDLGLNVVLCDLENAMQQSASFGVQQAVVISSPNNEEGLLDKMKTWLPTHPFILTVLESKGLEFDDIVIAFGHERSAWHVHRQTVASLQLLRQLYVAVTRAKRRVVILTKRNNPVMTEFFYSLNANIEQAEPDIISLEFEKQTTVEEWFARGKALLDDNKYALAESCFVAAQDFGWANRANGCKHLDVGQKDAAKECFAKAVRVHYENSEFEDCLDCLDFLMKLPPRDTSLDEILDSALRQRPHHLPPQKRVQYTLYRDSFDSLQVSDLANVSLAPLFSEYRGNDSLRRFIVRCSSDDRKRIQRASPLLIADYYYDKRQNLIDCTALYIKGGDFEMASKTTNFELEAVNGQEEEYVGWSSLAAPWISNASALSFAANTPNRVYLFVTLFKDPQALSSKRARECMRMLGNGAVRAAVMQHGLGIEGLHKFDRKAFGEEIREKLLSQFEDEPSKVVSWYLEHDDTVEARRFAELRLGLWSDKDFLETVLQLRPSGLVEEVARRNLYTPAVSFFLSGDIDLRLAEDISKKLLQMGKNADPNAVSALRRTWLTKSVEDARVKKLLHKGMMFGLPDTGDESDSDGDMPALLESRPGARLPARAFSMGDLVRIKGLKSEGGRKFNGKSGQITSLPESTGGGEIRYGTKIGNIRKLIKEENLELLAPAPPPRSPQHAARDGLAAEAPKDGSSSSDSESESGSEGSAEFPSLDNRSNSTSSGSANDNVGSDDEFSDVPGLLNPQNSSSDDSD